MDAYADADVSHGQGLSAYEHQTHKPKLFTWAIAKLLLISSTGFFIDAYDLFTINLIAPMLNYQYNGILSGDIAGIALSGGVLKAAANLGCIAGQLLFGWLSDVYGRKPIYPIGLVVTIIGTVLTVAAPNSLGPVGVLTWITVWRVIMGIGIGGDYPMSASVVSDRANLHRRGILLNFIFAMQGWGNFGGSIVSMVVLAAFKTGIRDHGNYGQFNAVWRVITGVILVPCLGTLAQRIMLPESTKFKNVQAMRENPDMIFDNDLQKENNGQQYSSESSKESKEQQQQQQTQQQQQEQQLATGNNAQDPEKQKKSAKAVAAQKSAAFREFIDYFSEWRHLKNLIGTAGCWFLLDIAFYGINLNQSIVITAMGLNNSEEPWQFMWDTTVANLIITAAGFLPGYYVCMIFIEILGRKTIQIGGFLLSALFLGIVAGDFVDLQQRKAGFIVCFAFLQFFFNFGPNTTTFIYPAEVFPTRVRGFAHGFSAACAKIGAVIAALAFSVVSKSIGTDNVLWIFFAICILGALLTLLLPETKGRDADIIDIEERKEAAIRTGEVH